MWLRAATATREHRCSHIVLSCPQHRRFYQGTSAPTVHRTVHALPSQWYKHGMGNVHACVHTNAWPRCSCLRAVLRTTHAVLVPAGARTCCMTTAVIYRSSRAAVHNFTSVLLCWVTHAAAAHLRRGSVGREDRCSLGPSVYPSPRTQSISASCQCADSRS